jgi:hypothetical protein
MQITKRNPAIISYRLGRAQRYLKKAQEILDEVELNNNKCQGNFYSLLDHCSQMALEQRCKLKQELEDIKCLSQ